MLTAGVVTAIVGIISVLATGGITVYNKRTTGPEASAQIVTASTLLLSQLQERIEVLERRLWVLEADNARYRALHGPLEPLEDYLDDYTEE